MTRRERLMKTLNGQPVDRPPVSFYEINGQDENSADPDPFNVYSHPSWQPVLQLAREKTDRILRRDVPIVNMPPDPMDELTTVETEMRNGSRFMKTTIHINNRTLTKRTRHDPDVNTIWTEEHLLKNVDDLKAYLDIPVQTFGGQPDPSSLLEAEAKLGDTGIVMVDTADPLCLAADLFEMGEYTVIAMTEPDLFHRLLERLAIIFHAKTEAIAKALPGRLWRIFGPEYASPPYLPPALFREYVCRYDQPMVDAIKSTGGYARLHSHGNLKAILDDIVGMGVDGLDPIEPPPQGDVDLAYVRQHYGKSMVLFGNLEANDLESLATPLFREKVKRALDEGTAGDGRGYVLMPSACPYGRELSALTVRNYEAIIECVADF